MSHPTSADVLVSRFRTGLLVLAGVGVAGTGVELAMIRHWQSLEQLIPWAALAVIAAAIGAVAWRPVAARVRAAQLFAAAVVLAATYGVIEHISSNLHAGPLDASYGPRWSTMSATAHLWSAATGAVGPAPPLAPAILVQISLCLLLATLAHPALSRRRAPVPTPSSFSATGTAMGTSNEAVRR